jgi:hypothetical protein
LPPIEAMQIDVERRMRRGERFSDVEDLINASELSGDEKSALWLLAWSYLDHGAQRRVAKAHLTELGRRTQRMSVKRRWRLHAV